MTARFRYFKQPHQFSTYQAASRRCDVCEHEGPGYGGPFYGTRAITFVCEDCLASGRLQHYGATTNDGNTEALRQQVWEWNPDLSDVERARLVQERTIELTLLTPHLVTWQEVVWPAHCGDYCRFIKEVGQPELAHPSPEGDGEAFFAAHAHDIADRSHAHAMWEGIRSDIPINGHAAYPVGVYLFRCLTCGEPVLLWDAD